MVFEIAADLPPELYSVAYLHGRWHGHGVLAYPGIEEFSFYQEAEFFHDGGPYWIYRSHIWVSGQQVDIQKSADTYFGDVDSEDAQTMSGAQVNDLWQTESGYWRIAPRLDENPNQPSELEVLLTDPAGYATVYLGEANQGKIQLASDLIAATSTSARVQASQRLYGLVGDELMWTWQLAAFDQDLQSYASARLKRR